MIHWKQIIITVVLSVLISQSLVLAYSPDTAASLPSHTMQIPVSALDRILDTGELRCAYIPYPPFFDIDPNTGEKHGVAYDLMEEIGRRWNINIAWTEEVGWANLTEGLRTGRYDAVCSAIWQNAARSLRADFSKPYGYSAVDIWARADDERFGGNITRINQRDIKIAVIDGEATEKLVTEHFPQAQIVSLPQSTPFSDVMLNVKNGKADIVMVEAKIAADFLTAHPDSLKKITQTKPFAAFPITVALPKGETELKTTIDNTLDEIFFTRKMDIILRRNNIEESAFYLPKAPF